MKPVGTIKIQLTRELAEVPAFRIGKFWAVNQAGHNSPYYHITHKNTGQALLTFLKLRRASKLIGVLDILMPSNLTSEIEQHWRTLPKEVRQSLLEK